MMKKDYDAIIIGAGMSGLAAGIRLAMYDKKVCILEKHFIPGGLNSYYQRGKRKFDVGLHAMTNFAKKGERGRPLTKLLKQLRIPYNDFLLAEQGKSKIHFPSAQLSFTNDFEYLKNEIHEKFPSQIDGFIKLVTTIENFNEVSLDNEYTSAKEVVKKFITDDTLLNMIFCPLMIYGSAWEHDMDFSQFVIMFKSIFLEGLCRPQGGVRTIIDQLVDKYKNLGGELHYKSNVKKIMTENGSVKGVIINDDEKVYAPLVISSAGLPETYNALDTKEVSNSPRVGKMTFTESIFMLDKMPKDLGIEDAIIFYNDSDEYLYRSPENIVDTSSAVMCFSTNFKDHEYQEGIYRATFMANSKKWQELEKVEYKKQKKIVSDKAFNLLSKITDKEAPNILFEDTFSPTTITKYTSHIDGTVYGSPDKSRDGSTEIDGLVICGTDQGFLGIVGSMLSGISMANLYGLQGGR